MCGLLDIAAPAQLWRPEPMLSQCRQRRGAAGGSALESNGLCPSCTRFPAAPSCSSEAVGLRVDGTHLVPLLLCGWASPVSRAAVNQA